MLRIIGIVVPIKSNYHSFICHFNSRIGALKFCSDVAAVVEERPSSTLCSVVSRFYIFFFSLGTLMTLIHVDCTERGLFRLLPSKNTPGPFFCFR